MGVVLAGGALGDGPSWYRVEVPARWLRGRGADVKTVYNDVNWKEIEGARTFSTQRGWHPSLLLVVRALQQKGVRTVYELDDDVWSVPDWNPLRPWFTGDHVRGMEAVLRACDEVTVSTERLASLVARHGVGPVHVVPNALPMDLFPGPAERTRPGVRVGWFGSDTHSRDLEAALPGLRRVLRERMDATLVFMGARPEQIPLGERVEYHEWVSGGEAYYAALRALQLDVLVAPLVDHRFNYAKSNIKALEAGALGLAIVASDVGPYQCLRNGETGLKVKANRPDLWAGLLMDVTGDEGLRARLGAGARAWVEAEGTMEATGPKWAEALGV